MSIILNLSGTFNNIGTCYGEFQIPGYPVDN
jgi:hypothetical protein